MPDAANDQRRRYERGIAQVVANAWADADFKRRLLSNPTATLRERGIEIPATQEMTVVENTSEVENLFVLPKKEASALKRATESATDGRAKSYSELMLKIAEDGDFKRRFLENTRITAIEYGIQIPVGKRINIVELNPGQVGFILPEKPPQVFMDSLELRVDALSRGALITWGAAAGTGCLIVAAVL
jgi:nitrile hydratase subunit alpha